MDIAELERRVKRLERLLADHYHGSTGIPCTTEGRWPTRMRPSVPEVLERPLDEGDDSGHR